MRLNLERCIPIKESVYAPAVTIKDVICTSTGKSLLQNTPASIHAGILQSVVRYFNQDKGRMTELQQALRFVPWKQCMMKRQLHPKQRTKMSRTLTRHSPKFSLRQLQKYLTQYLKQKGDDRTKHEDIIFGGYHDWLGHYGKALFDVFCRQHIVTVKLSDNTLACSSVGQLNCIKFVSMFDVTRSLCKNRYNMARYKSNTARTKRKMTTQALIHALKTQVQTNTGHRTAHTPANTARTPANTAHTPANTAHTCDWPFIPVLVHKSYECIPEKRPNLSTWNGPHHLSLSAVA